MEGRYNDHDCPFETYIVNLKKHEQGEDVGEWLPLPTTPEKLREALLAVGGDRDGWRIQDVKSHIYGINTPLSECENINELNYLAAKIEELDEEGLEYFQAVIEIDEHCDTTAELINLTDNLDCYEIQPNISDYTDLGKWDLYERSQFLGTVIDALADYLDFDSYGYDVACGEGGKLAEACYVYPSGMDFYEEYHGEPATIPKDYVVYTPDLLNLTPEEMLEWAIPLAVSLDSFFRDFDSGYAAQYPDISAQQEALCDSLMDGKIAAIDDRLADLGQEEQDALPSELADFKRLSCYDPEKEKPETMRVLVVEPREPPCVKEISSGLEGLTDIVGGPIAATYPFPDNVGVICNDEGRNMGLELNRALYDSQGQVYDVIPGTFIVAGLGDDNFTSLPEDMIEKYARRFQTIEVYAQVGNRTIMFQVPQDTVDLSDQHIDSVIRDKLNRKPSIRERLAAAKEECANNPTPERIHKRSEHEL